MMKINAPTIQIILFASVISFFNSQLLPAQGPYMGRWEGTFMQDFKTVLKIHPPSPVGEEGKILMFSGEDIIQDDAITKVKVKDHRLSFHIEAKETDFDGSFNENYSELSGIFIFPDGSEHPVALFKIDDTASSAQGQKQSFPEMKKKTYTASELVQDVGYLMECLSGNHPRLSDVSSRHALEEAMNEVLGKVHGEQNLESFFRLIGPLVEKVHCSHTGIRLPASYQELVYKHGNFFPLKLFFEENKAFNLSVPVQSDPGFMPGMEVLSINRVPVSEILHQIFSLIPAQEHAVSSKFFEINRNFHSYFYLLDDSDRFEVLFNTPSGMKTIQLEACGYDHIISPIGLESSDFPVAFSIDDNKELGKIRLASFGIKDINRYILYLDSVFRVLLENETPGLVIDLRGNSGGHPIFAAQLLSHVTDDEFTYFKRNPAIPDFEPLYNPMHPADLHYPGDLYIYVDGGCLSTTGHLISLLRQYTDAVFIGEQPGSTFTCNDFSRQFSLPHTGIEVNVPRTSFETAVSDSVKYEVFPLDYQVHNTVIDLAAGKDRCDETVVGLTGKNRTDF